MTIIHKCSQALTRFLRVDFDTFMKGWSWLFSSQAVGACVALLLAYGYANYLPQDLYGTYKYLLSVFAILAIFSLQGMETASQHSVAQGKEGAFWKTFKVRIYTSAIAVLGSTCLGIYYLVNGNEILGYSFIVASPFLFFFSTFNHHNSLLMGRQMFRQASYNSIIVQVLAGIGIFITTLKTNDVFTLILVYLALFVTIRGTVFYFTLRRFKPNKVEDEDVMRYGTHMSIVGVISILTNQLSPILLWHFLGATELAIYSFALAVVGQLTGVYKVATTKMAFPKFSSIDVKTLKETLPRKALYAHSITIPLSIVLILIIPLVYQILFPTYMDSVPYAQALTLLFAFSPLRFFSTALLAKGTAKSIHIYNFVHSTSLLVLLLITIPIFGIWGVVYSNAIYLLITSSLSIFLFKKITVATT